MSYTITAPREIVYALARAVEAQGGDADDLRDLLAVWEAKHPQREQKPPPTTRPSTPTDRHTARRHTTSSRPRRRAR
jgi:hypothetical protein